MKGIELPILGCLEFELKEIRVSAGKGSGEFNDETGDEKRARLGGI
jgi:hypothetical protein